MAGGTASVLFLCSERGLCPCGVHTGAERNSFSGFGRAPDGLIAGSLGRPVNRPATMSLPSVCIEQHWSWRGHTIVGDENLVKPSIFRCDRERSPAWPCLSRNRCRQVNLFEGLSQ